MLLLLRPLSDLDVVVVWGKAGRGHGLRLDMEEHLRCRRRVVDVKEGATEHHLHLFLILLDSQGIHRVLRHTCYCGGWSSSPLEEMMISSFTEDLAVDEDDGLRVQGRCLHEPPEPVSEPSPRPMTCPSPKL